MIWLYVRRNEWETRLFTKTVEQEREENAGYVETDEDRLRRKIAAELNGAESEYVPPPESGFGGHPIRLPIDACKLFGLDPTDPDISYEQLKTSYHSLLKRWHPDVYRGDRKVAEAMTKQLNEAYRQLQPLLKNRRSTTTSSSKTTSASASASTS